MNISSNELTFIKAMNLRNDSEHVTQVGAGVQCYCCIMHRAAHNSPRLDTKHILDGVLCTTIAIMLLLSVTVPYRLPRDLLSGVRKVEKRYLWRSGFGKFRYLLNCTQLLSYFCYFRVYVVKSYLITPTL